MRKTVLPPIALPTLCSLGLLALACAKPPEPPPFRPVAGSRLLMLSLLEPAADVLWDAVRVEMTLEGTTEFQPQTDEEWTAVRNAAVLLAESGNLLMMERRAVDQGDWIGWSQALVDAGEAAMQAADARDPDAIFDAGAAVYETCSGCHQTYWPESVEPAR
jgi:hypothetical protein